MQLNLDHEEFSQAEQTGLLARLARRKGWCLLGFSLTAAMVTITFTAVPRTYRASASLLFASNEAVLRSDNASAEAQRLGDPADIESQMLMLRSPRLGRVVVRDPAVVAALVADCEAAREGTWATRLLASALQPPKCDNLAQDELAQLHRMEGGFSIGPTGRSRVIEVSFASPVPETSVTLANALVDAYLRDDKERKVDTHDNAINWLTAEIAGSGQALRDAELRVEAYRSERGLVRGQLAPITSERLSALSQQLAAAQGAYAQALSRQSPASDSSRELLDSRSVSDLKQQAAMVGAHYAELRGRYGENYPAVLAAAEQQREVNARLGQETRRVGQSVQKDVQAAAARVSELKGQYDVLTKDVASNGGAEAAITILVSDVEARREIYVEQLKKVNILQTERRLLAGDARLVNHAELPDRPWFPKRLPFVAVGMVLASVVGAAAGLARDRDDRTLRATSNLPKLAGVPVAGLLPWVRARRGMRLPVRHMHNSSPLQESVRALFGRLFLMSGQVPKTLMIGSSDVGEGKTFLTLVLSLFAVTTKRRVLVIETDLRRPTIRTALNLPESAGLREYLLGKAQLSDIVQTYVGLDVITAGQPGIDSTELLSRGGFEVLLRMAAAKYDLVILDSPPSLLLMDSQVLARRVDGIVYCASLGRSRLDHIQLGVRSLEAAGGRVLGIVVGGRRGEELPRYDVPGLLGAGYLPELA